MSKETRKRVLCRFIERFRPSSPSSSGYLPFLKRFTYKEIKRATDGFSRVIGGGGGGAAYKAQFPDGLVGIVRKVQALEAERDGGAAAFHRELLFLARLHHRHLVRLLGFSDEQDRFLVFDYMENGSLRETIHDPLRTPLTWGARLKIVIDVAVSLEYLCLFCEPRPCNLTVSADNILLGGDSAAKLLTLGSMSSEEQGDSKGDDRRILFQFGALILELVTGQSFGSEGEDLVRWIEGSDFSKSMDVMVDSDMGNAYDWGEVRRLLFVARLCVTKVNGGPDFSISHALRFLQRKMELSSPP